MLSRKERAEKKEEEAQWEREKKRRMQSTAVQRRVYCCSWRGLQEMCTCSCVSYWLCVCLCACEWVSVFVCMWVCLCACEFVCVHVSECACMWVSVRACEWVCVHVSLCACMWVCESVDVVETDLGRISEYIKCIQVFLRLVEIGHVLSYSFITKAKKRTWNGRTHARRWVVSTGSTLPQITKNILGYLGIKGNPWVLLKNKRNVVYVKL